MKKKVKDLFKNNVELDLIRDVTNGIAVVIGGYRIMGNKVFNGKTLYSKKLKVYDLEDIVKIIFGWDIGKLILEQEIEVEENENR